MEDKKEDYKLFFFYVEFIIIVLEFEKMRKK